MIDFLISCGNSRKCGFMRDSSAVTAVAIRKRMLRLLVSVFVGYILVLLLVRVFEARFVFFPDYPGRLAGDWNPRNLVVQDVWLTSSDGTKLHAWWIPNEKGNSRFWPFTETLATSPTALRYTNFSATRPEMYSHSNIVVMATAKGNPANEAFIETQAQPTTIS